MKRAIQIQLLLLLLYFLTVCSSSSTSHGENHRCPVNSGLSVYCSWPEAASPPFLGYWPHSSCRRRETHDRYEEEMLVNSVYHVFDLDFIWIYSVCLFFYVKEERNTHKKSRLVVFSQPQMFHVSTVAYLDFFFLMRSNVSKYTLCKKLYSKYISAIVHFDV